MPKYEPILCLMWINLVMTLKGKTEDWMNYVSRLNWFSILLFERRQEDDLEIVLRALVIREINGLNPRMDLMSAFDIDKDVAISQVPLRQIFHVCISYLATPST
ncbi:hypothetical protein BpHYR1_043060 [Brachionus plicatilis]|uniref:Uncharacterized protein n=1 Tax=Brachionus plicatilis TaxID=10195 RepID=A0A3M7RF32_BRAPC|nr:hypothetical protein BpHYR1_043060 [Brachionus plicatilis]